MEGTSQNETTLSPCQPPLAEYEQVCYSTPRKWAASPLRFLEACRIREHWGTHGGPLRREALRGASPAAAVAATNPALGQGAPGGCSPSPATLRGSPAPEPTPLQVELLEAIRPRCGSLRLVTARYGLLRLCYGSTPETPNSADKRNAYSKEGGANNPAGTRPAANHPSSPPYLRASQEASLSGYAAPRGFVQTIPARPAVRLMSAMPPLRQAP